MLQPNHPFVNLFWLLFVMQGSWARCGSDFASVFQRKWLHDFRYSLLNKISNNPISEYINCVMYISNICLIQTKGMGKVWHPGMPNTPKGDDYPKSWSEKVFYLKSKWKTVQCPWLVTELKKERSWKLVSRCSTQIPLMTQASHGKLTLRRKWRKPPWGPLEVPPNENTCSAQGHCKHRLHNWETEGTGPGGTCGRTELFCCLRSSQGTLLHLNYACIVSDDTVFFVWLFFPASSAVGLSGWILWSLPRGSSWLTS